ncbi:NAD(P)/FAD-dependent oxidoreductase [Nonomuraea guangzhouensis]|uniref:NAD(P)/FAD-dependent oxidoreductase n=1 Tax=Nonomuraea guangzhouensis TaxID=1291555 RepID=A0ABW4GVC1_9ACTN|nr:FAD-dependent oxidoreductase [Nonomuraea guangzhouensis]
MRVAVIGSGIVGAAAAWWLSGRGVSVTVVDGAFSGRATEAGAGIVCPWVDHAEDDAWYALAREGARRYPELVSALGVDIGYARVGALLVAQDPAELEPVRALLLRRRPHAPEMGDITDVAAPSALFPPLGPGLSAIHVPGAARVDGRAVRDALLHAAVRRGTELRTGTATLTPGGTVLLHPTAGETGIPVAAEAVIVAAGAWSGEVCRALGVELPVFPRRGQIVHAALDGVDTASWPIVLPRSGPYLLGFPGSRLVVGATVEDAGFSPCVTVGGIHEVLAAGLRVAPGLDGARVVETRVGLRPVHAAGTALIERLTERVVVATGLGAYGLTAGPFTGEIAAALALGEPSPIDIRPYAHTPA